MAEKNGEEEVLEPEQARKIFVGGVNFKTTGMYIVRSGVYLVLSLVAAAQWHRTAKNWDVLGYLLAYLFVSLNIHLFIYIVLLVFGF